MSDEVAPASVLTCSIPTIMVLRGGEPLDSIVDALPKKQLVARLVPHLAPAG